MKGRFAVLLYISWLLCCCDVEVQGTLSKSSQKKKKKETTTKASTQTVFQKGLVTESAKSKDILKNHKSYCQHSVDQSAFSGQVLGYVTPWNNHGYDVAKIFNGKFTYISPVWLQVKRRRGGTYAIEGGHDIDKGWVKDVKKGGTTKLVPRLLFDGWSASDYHSLFMAEESMAALVNTVVGFCKSYEFDGLVLEIWSQFSGDSKQELYMLISKLADGLHQIQMKMILVIPPAVTATRTAGYFDNNDYELLFPVVDAFSLMTYDYSSGRRPGPNAPLDWVRENVLTLAPNPGPHRKKILLGLNFYGMDYSMSSTNAIVGTSFIELLEKYKPKLQWEKEHSEHSLKYGSGGMDHVVYYPSLKSIQTRLDLAAELGVGISIWEIGQGLDFFYDLL